MSTTPGDTGQTTAPSTIQPQTVLGLPVDTFAFILLGIGIGGSIIFIVLYCLLKAYCRGKCCCCPGPRGSPGKRSKFNNVRELWEHDTRKRKQELADAGYVNDAFSNLDELSVFALQTDISKEVQGPENSNNNNKYAHTNGISHKHKSKVKHSMSVDSILKKKQRKAPPFRYSKSNPEVSSSKELPALQVNGEALANTEFDQFPKNKLGSSLVRIEEEVIVEEEEDVQKDKSKNSKKSKLNKHKNHLAANVSSDGYAAEEEPDIIVAMAPARYSPPSILTSEVVVHVDNDPSATADAVDPQNDTTVPDSLVENDPSATVGAIEPQYNNTVQDSIVENDTSTTADTVDPQNDTTVQDSPVNNGTNATADTVEPQNDTTVQDSLITESTQVNNLTNAVDSALHKDTIVQELPVLEKPDHRKLNNIDKEQPLNPDNHPGSADVGSKNEKSVTNTESIVLGSPHKSTSTIVNSQQGLEPDDGVLLNSENTSDQADVKFDSDEIIGRSSVLRDSSDDTTVLKNSAALPFTKSGVEVLGNHIGQPNLNSLSSATSNTVNDHEIFLQNHRNLSVDPKREYVSKLNQMSNGINSHGPRPDIDNKTASMITKSNGVRNGGIRNMGISGRDSSERFGLREAPFLEKRSSNPKQLSSWLHGVYVAKDD